MVVPPQGQERAVGNAKLAPGGHVQRALNVERPRVRAHVTHGETVHRGAAPAVILSVPGPVVVTTPVEASLTIGTEKLAGVDESTSTVVPAVGICSSSPVVEPAKE